MEHKIQKVCLHLKNFHVSSTNIFHIENRDLCNISSNQKIPKRYKNPESFIEDFKKWTQNQKELIDMTTPLQDFEGNRNLRRSLWEIGSIHDKKYHQYPKKHGQQRLLEAVSRIYCKFIKHDLIPNENILITNGLRTAIYCAIMAFVQEGDEVVLIEPFKSCYERIVREAGGICRYVPIRVKFGTQLDNSKELKFDATEVAQTFNKCTKMVIINNPHLPFGRLLEYQDFKLLTNLCEIHNCICLSDESLEYLIYDPYEMLRISKHKNPCMWDRTITVSSADVFNIPGVNVAWGYGPKWIIDRTKHVHSLLSKGGHIPVQEAVSVALEREHDILCADCGYMQQNLNLMTTKRTCMHKILRNAGFQPCWPQAGPYMVADWTPMIHRVNLKPYNDQFEGFRYARWLAQTIGIKAFPLGAFYGRKNRELAERFMVFNFLQPPAKHKHVDDLFENWKEDVLNKKYTSKG